jgi:hypothetical protein
LCTSTVTESCPVSLCRADTQLSGKHPGLGKGFGADLGPSRPRVTGDSIAACKLSWHRRCSEAGGQLVNDDSSDASAVLAVKVDGTPSSRDFMWSVWRCHAQSFVERRCTFLHIAQLPSMGCHS